MNADHRPSTPKVQRNGLLAFYASVWRPLGISPSLIRERGLPLFEEATELVVADSGAGGREYQLTPVAALAWQRMKVAAEEDGVDLQVVSAYRSVARQAELIGRRLAAGQSLDAVLSVLAPPGCSEHHTGRAVDIATGNVMPLEPEFEATPAFSWLLEHAGAHGFTLSFPRNNPYGYIYEPWHWCLSEAPA